MLKCPLLSRRTPSFASQPESPKELGRRFLPQQGGPYLPSEEMRSLLFPQASAASVFSAEEPGQPDNLDQSLGTHASDLEDVPREEEESDLLNLPMDTDEDTSSRPVSRASTPPNPPPGFPPQPQYPSPAQPGPSLVPNTSAILQEMLALLQKQGYFKPHPQTPSDVIPPYPRDSHNPRNPWYPCTLSSLSEDDTLLRTPQGTLKVEDIEFSHSVSNFPNIYFRYKARDEDKVPSETIVYSEKCATNILGHLSDGLKCDKVQVDVLGTGKPLRVVPSAAASCPFTIKALTEAHEAFTSGLQQVRPLKEYVSLAAFCPQATSLTKFMAGYKELISSKEISVHAATLELGDQLPLIPKDLIKAEFEARKEMVEAISLSTISEGMAARLQKCDITATPLSDSPEDIEATKNIHIDASHGYAVINKIAFRRTVTAITNFINAKKAIREVVLKATKSPEAESVKLSTPFCKGLFPQAMIFDLKQRASTSGISLAQRWHIPTVHQSKQTFKAPKNPRSYGQQSRRGGQKPYKRQQRPHKPQPHPASPVANPAREQQYQAQQTYNIPQTQQQPQQPFRHQQASRGQGSKGGKRGRGGKYFPQK